MSTLVRTLSVAAAATLAAAPLFAQTSPAPAKAPAKTAASAAPATSPFVGVWDLNVAKSDFGVAAASAPTKATMTISRSGSVVTLGQALTMGGQERTGTTDYAMVGHDTTTNGPDGLPITNNGTMTDSAVTLTTKLNRQGMDITMLNHWTLSPDRKVLTVTQDTQTPMGAVKVSLVYDRKQ
jgi:hypothetical protein